MPLAVLLGVVGCSTKSGGSAEGVDASTYETDFGGDGDADTDADSDADTDPVGNVEITRLNGGTGGTTTRYWDCCKPSCGWTANASNPVNSCDINDNNIIYPANTLDSNSTMEIRR